MIFSSLQIMSKFIHLPDDYYYPSLPIATLNEKMRKTFSKVYKKIIIGKCCLVGTSVNFITRSKR